MMTMTKLTKQAYDLCQTMQFKSVDGAVRPLTLPDAEQLLKAIRAHEIVFNAYQRKFEQGNTPQDAFIVAVLGDFQWNFEVDSIERLDWYVDTYYDGDLTALIDQIQFDSTHPLDFIDRINVCFKANQDTIMQQLTTTSASDISMDYYAGEIL